MSKPTVVIAFAFLLIVGVPSTAATGKAAASLRLNEPLEAVVADLEALVPAYVEQEGVPGGAVALVRDGRLVWTEEVGVTNGLTLLVSLVVLVAAMGLALTALS